MFDFLYQMPNLGLLLLISLTFVLISFFCILLVKHLVPLELRYKDNSVIGTISSLISIIYGVLVGLTALYLINNINYTTDAVQREASAASDIYRDSQWLLSPTKENIQHHVKDYLHQVINVEWPAMQKGAMVSKKGIAIIEKINIDMSHYIEKTAADSIIIRDMLEEVKNLYDAREQRIHMSHFKLNTEMWIVILIGTILTIAINFIFGMNYYLHLLSVSAVALMTAAMVFLVLTLERPFQGEFVVEPSALNAVINLIENPIT